MVNIQAVILKLINLNYRYSAFKKLTRNELFTEISSLITSSLEVLKQLRITYTSLTSVWLSAIRTLRVNTYLLEKEKI